MAHETQRPQPGQRHPPFQFSILSISFTKRILKSKIYIYYIIINIYQKKGEVLLKRLRHLPHGEYYIQELESDDTYIEKDPNLL